MNDTKLMYSEIVYLFADKFIPQRAKLANMEVHPTGEKIPVKPLGELMVMIALLFLKENGYISDEIREIKKLFVLSGKDVFATKLKSETEDLSGIEERLLRNIDTDTKLQKAVYDLLSSDEIMPWGHIINISKHSLVEKGYMTVMDEKKFLGAVKKYVINSEKIGEAKSLIEHVNNALADFSKSGDLYKLTLTAIKRGITLREEREDSSD